MTASSILIACALSALSSITQAQTLTYAWPSLGMDPCSEWLNCETGCSACNAPVSSSAALIGSAAAWINVDACAHPVTEDNNVVHISGWGPGIGEQRVILGLVSLRIDSIIVRHAAGTNGPDLLRISYVRIGPSTEGSEADVTVHSGFATTIINNAGALRAEGNQAFGVGQVILQAYGGGPGPWLLDEVRIVTSPDISTGISVNTDILPPAGMTMPYDLLGRHLSAPAFGRGPILRFGSTTMGIAP